MTDPKEILGNQIREARKGKQMTQQNLADKLGITRHQVAKYESGRNNMTIETIQRISDVLGISFTINPS